MKTKKDEELSSGMILNFFKEYELPSLFFVGVFISALSWMVILLLSFFFIFINGGGDVITNARNLQDLEGLLTPKNYQLIILYLCMCNMVKPATWLMLFAKNPSNFLSGSGLTKGLKYKPAQWFYFWSIFYLCIIFVLGNWEYRYQKVVMFREAINSNQFLIFICSIFSIVCLLTIQHFKKTIKLHE